MKPFNKALHRYSMFVAFCTLLLIIAGGLVTSTSSGLSVPDWPNTYGHFMFAFPLEQMVGGIFYEHSHRMIASVVGFFTVILTIWIWRKEDRDWMRYLGVAALGAVIAQGVLGGLTVLFLLPTWISTLHATLAQTFFVIVSAIALFTSKWWHDNSPALKERPGIVPLRILLSLTTLAIFIQLILGAIMRHSNAGLAVPDFPLAYSQFFPSLSDDALVSYNQRLEDLGLRVFADEPITASQVLIHMTHRLWACVVACMVLWSAVRIGKYSSAHKRLSILSKTLFTLIIAQLTLGAFTVLTQKAVDITTIHVATGAILLVVSFITLLHVIKIFGLSPERVTIPVTAKEVTT